MPVDRQEGSVDFLPGSFSWGAIEMMHGLSDNTAG